MSQVSVFGFIFLTSSAVTVSLPGAASFVAKVTVTEDDRRMVGDPLVPLTVVMENV
jgi:hypothetical protein